MIIWKPIKEFEGLYLINQLGDIKSIINGIILKKRFQTNGYEIATLCKSGEKKTFRVHRLVAEAFIDNPENKPFVNHIDEDKINNNYLNLQWSTFKENMDHSYKKIFKTRNRKLNEDQIKLIRELKKKKMKQKDISKIFKISETHISNILSNNRRKELIK